MWQLPPNLDVTKAINFYAYYGVEDEAADNVVAAALKYSAMTIASTGVVAVDPATTTGVTNAADLTVDHATNYDYKMQQHGPFIIAASTFAAANLGLGTLFGWSLTFTFTTIDAINLLGVLVRYTRNYF
jgi:hypothetical protein